MQSSLFPLEVVRTDPPQQGVDVFAIATASDGLTYYLKHPISHPNVPLTEWVCNHIAHQVGLPTVGVNQLQLKCGTIAFGSRAEASAKSLPDDKTARMLIAPQLIKAVSNPHIYSSCFILDLFLSNPDRHLGNFLYQSLNNKLVIRVIDFSRSFPATTCLSIEDILQSNTGITYNLIRSMTGICLDHNNAIFDKLAKIKIDYIENLIDSAHHSWTNNDTKESLLEFWEHKRDARLQEIAEHIKNEIL
ncbi:MAG: HipA family kinase [Mucilaginibacter sp.]